MAEPYVPDLFVGRTTPLANIIGWTYEKNPVQRVLSVVGPPGVGKSYLLHRTYDSLKAAGRLVFWIDLSRDPAIRGECPDVIIKDGPHQWLKMAIEQSRKVCKHVRGYDGTTSLEVGMYSLATDLCERCDLMPILVVDGFEEIDQAWRDWLEESMLAQFISRDCTRIIIGRRDEFALNSPSLRWTEGKEILSVMDEAESGLQVKTRLKNWDKRKRRTHDTKYLPPTELIENLHTLYAIPPYAWNHPGINTFLLERIVPRHQAGSEAYLTADDLRRCVLEITTATAQLSQPQLECLLAVATRLPLTWANEDLTDNLKIVIEDEDLAELFRRGIVFNIEGTPLYQVADGIRELIQTWQGLLNLPLRQEG